MNNFESQLERDVKNSVGYFDARDKKSFMVGVSVAFNRTEKHYESQMDFLRRELENYKKMYENVNNDITKLASIVMKYSENE